ncbi:hypothetical protein LZ30DRAFT_714596 [Colletotrichum cereale]|nr:hypothetical protein LZ30DRAFT_714596 [Colletotrichum cereale]
MGLWLVSGLPTWVNVLKITFFVLQLWAQRLPRIVSRPGTGGTDWVPNELMTYNPGVGSVPSWETFGSGGMTGARRQSAQPQLLKGRRAPGLLGS